MPPICTILYRTCAGVIAEAAEIAKTEGCDKSEGEPVSVQNDLDKGSCYSSEPKNVKRYALIYRPMRLTIPHHVLIPCITFVPPILNHLYLPFLSQSSEDPDVIGVANTNHAYFAFVLKFNQHPPSLKRLLDGSKRRMQ